MYPVGALNTATVMGNTGIAFPNAVDGGLYFVPVPFGEGGTGGPIRGRLRGLFIPMHAQPLANYDQVTPTSGVPGGTVLMAATVASNSTVGQVLIDVTGPW